MMYAECVCYILPFLIPTIHQHQECQIDLVKSVHQVIAAARFTNWARNFRHESWFYSDPNNLNDFFTPFKWDGQTPSDPIVEAITMRFSHVSISEASTALSLLRTNVRQLLLCPPGIQGETKMLGQFREVVSRVSITDFLCLSHLPDHTDIIRSLSLLSTISTRFIGQQTFQNWRHLYSPHVHDLAPVFCCLVGSVSVVSSHITKKLIGHPRLALGSHR